MHEAPNISQKSRRSYNNFDAPPVMRATSSRHYSPSRLYTTRIGGDSSRRHNSYMHRRHYIDESEFEYDKNIIKGIFQDLYRQACEVD